jgi:hypothetical protein
MKMIAFYFGPPSPVLTGLGGGPCAAFFTVEPPSMPNEVPRFAPLWMQHSPLAGASTEFQPNADVSLTTRRRATSRLDHMNCTAWRR